MAVTSEHPWWLVAIAPVSGQYAQRFVRLPASAWHFAKAAVDRDLNHQVERVVSVAREEWVRL